MRDDRSVDRLVVQIQVRPRIVVLIFERLAYTRLVLKKFIVNERGARGKRERVGGEVARGEVEGEDWGPRR